VGCTAPVPTEVLAMAWDATREVHGWNQEQSGPIDEACGVQRGSTGVNPVGQGTGDQVGLRETDCDNITRCMRLYYNWKRQDQGLMSSISLGKQDKFPPWNTLRKSHKNIKYLINIIKYNSLNKLCFPDFFPVWRPI